MPTVESGPFKGMKAEVCLNPFGVFNRINISQLVEHELNFVSMHIRLKMKQAKTLKDKSNILFDYLKLVNKKEHESIKTWYDTLNVSQQKELIEEIIVNGVPIHQAPFYGNSNIDDLERIYDAYPEVEAFKCKNIATPIIISELYFIRLKHEPSSKFSARSTSFLNLKGLPAKSKSFKEYKDLYSKTPVRIGNMEIANLSLVNNMDQVMNLLNSYANNDVNRRELIEQSLTGNPLDTTFDFSNVESNTSKIIKSLITCLGGELVDDDTVEEQNDEEDS